LEQSLTLDQNFTGEFTYTFPPNMIFTVIVTNADKTFSIESTPIYTFKLKMALNKSISYTGSNLFKMTLSNHNNLIKSGLIYINDVSYVNNPVTIKNNQIDFTIIKQPEDLIDNNITFKSLDNNLSVSSIITHSSIEIIIDSDENISNYLIIRLNSWNPLISSVDLYNNNDFVGKFSVVYQGSYYIILNVVFQDSISLTIKIDDNVISVNDPNNLLSNNNTNLNLIASLSIESNIVYLTSPNPDSLSYIYTATTKYHSGKIGSGINDLSFVGKNLDKVDIQSKKLPLYIITSSTEIEPIYINTPRIYGYSNIISEQGLTKYSNLTGLVDQINTFNIDLDPRYINIEVNDSTNIIDYQIDNNKIIFSYDSGFELSSLFQIINNMTKEVYEIIKVNYN
jgi:hypothetical protein